MKNSKKVLNEKFQMENDKLQMICRAVVPIALMLKSTQLGPQPTATMLHDVTKFVLRV